MVVKTDPRQIRRGHRHKKLDVNEVGLDADEGIRVVGSAGVYSPGSVTLHSMAVTGY